MATSRTRAVLGEHSSDVLLYHSPGSSGTVRVSRDPSQPSTRLSESGAARSRSRAAGFPRLGGWWCRGAGPQGPAPKVPSSARPRSHGGRFARATASIEALLDRHSQDPSGFWWQLITPALGRTGQPVWSRAGGRAASVACCEQRSRVKRRCLISSGAWRRSCVQRVVISVVRAHCSCLAGIPRARRVSKRSVLLHGGSGRETTWLVEGNRRSACRLASARHVLLCRSFCLLVSAPGCPGQERGLLDPPLGVAAAAPDHIPARQRVWRVATTVLARGRIHSLRSGP